MEHLVALVKFDLISDLKILKYLVKKKGASLSKFIMKNQCWWVFIYHSNGH